MTMIDVDNPFDQSEYYYSESARDLVRINEMAPQYCLNAWRKMLREYPDDFPGSKMSAAMYEHIRPPRAKVRELLQTKGRCMYLCFRKWGSERAMFYTVGKQMGVKIRTHKRLIGETVWMEGEVVSDMSVTLRAVNTKVTT